MKDIVKNFRNIQYGPSPEDAKEVNKWIANLKKPNHFYINGKWIKSKSTKAIQSINPANNSKLFSDVLERITERNDRDFLITSSGEYSLSNLKSL